MTKKLAAKHSKLNNIKKFFCIKLLFAPYLLRLISIEFFINNIITMQFSYWILRSQSCTI